MTRIGILGGTFDPVHLGHTASARHTAAAFGLDRVLLVLSARPPHKPDAAPAPVAGNVPISSTIAPAAPSTMLRIPAMPASLIALRSSLARIVSSTCSSLSRSVAPALWAMQVVVSITLR